MLYQMLWSYALLNMVGVYVAFGLFVLVACRVEASEQQEQLVPAVAVTRSERKLPESA
jgi:hypothetical protein